MKISYYQFLIEDVKSAREQTWRMYGPSIVSKTMNSLANPGQSYSTAPFEYEEAKRLIRDHNKGNPDLMGYEKLHHALYGLLSDHPEIIRTHVERRIREHAPDKKYERAMTRILANGDYHFSHGISSIGKRFADYDLLAKGGKLNSKYLLWTYSQKKPGTPLVHFVSGIDSGPFEPCSFETDLESAIKRRTNHMKQLRYGNSMSDLLGSNWKHLGLSRDDPDYLAADRKSTEYANQFKYNVKPETDYNRFDSEQELINIVRRHQDWLDDKRYGNLREGVHFTTVHDSEHGTVQVPHCEFASRKLSEYTDPTTRKQVRYSWCTSSSSSTDHFARYSENNGKLFIYKPRNPTKVGEAYLVHAQPGKGITEVADMDNKHNVPHALINALFPKFTLDDAHEWSKQNKHIEPLKNND